MSAVRHLRDPLPQEEFNRLPLTAKALKLTGHWFSLRWREHATPEKLFFASASGRLTPGSGHVPCLYLARDCETSFEEVYGDFYDAAQKRGVVFTMPLVEAHERLFLQAKGSIDLDLYDLTSRGAASRIGLDLGTLYHPEIDHTRKFAQRLHDHPAGFDGILYRSRLMSTRCVVIWATRRGAGIQWEQHSILKDHLRGNPGIDPDYFLFKRRTRLAAAL